MSTLKTCKITVITGEVYGTLPEPTKSGDTFTGWYTSSTGGNLITKSSIVAITKNTTLYAHWLSSQGATVTISVNGGTSSPASATITSGGSSEFTITPSSGHTLTGATVSCPQATSKINASTGVVTISDVSKSQTCIVTLHDESATITTRTITYYGFLKTYSSWPTSINSDGTLHVQSIGANDCPITYDIICTNATCSISSDNSTRVVMISNPTSSVMVSCLQPGTY